MKIEDTPAVVTVSTNVSTGCSFSCAQTIGGPDEFESGINHLISHHGFVLLHVGGDTSHGPDGAPWHGTMAVLGAPKGGT